MRVVWTKSSRLNDRKPGRGDDLPRSSRTQSRRYSTQRVLALVAALTVVIGAEAWATPPADTPISVLVNASELVVVGRVVAVEDPIRRELRLPHMDEPAPSWFRTYRVQVEQVLKGDGASSGDVLSVLARDPGLTSGGEPMPPPKGHSMPLLRTGDAYILMLQELTVPQELFLPDGVGNFRLATTENVKAVEEAIKSP